MCLWSNFKVNGKAVTLHTMKAPEGGGEEV
jgi:hypothetical protein